MLKKNSPPCEKGNYAKRAPAPQETIEYFSSNSPQDVAAENYSQEKKVDNIFTENSGMKGATGT